MESFLTLDYELYTDIQQLTEDKEKLTRQNEKLTHEKEHLLERLLHEEENVSRLKIEVTTLQTKMKNMVEENTQEDEDEEDEEAEEAAEEAGGGPSNRNGISGGPSTRNGIKENQCRFCSKVLSDITGRIKHENLHLATYECRVCGLVVNRGSELRRHMLSIIKSRRSRLRCTGTSPRQV